MSGDVRTELRGPALWVTFDRPEAHNAMTFAMYEALFEACERADADAAVSALVLRGAGGKAFAAGNEISDFVGNEDVVEYEDWIREMLDGLFRLPQVTIAAVDGVCVGGGLAVATSCDLRVATVGSRFGYPIARTLGNALSSPVLYRCAAVFGESLTREMLLASRLVGADRAHAVGAVLAVLPDRAALDAEVEVMVDGIRQASPVTIRATKHQLGARARLTETAPADEEALLHEVYGGPDFAEGVRAFLAKEKPAFGRG